MSESRPHQFKPPFEIYHDECCIADESGHVLMAENPEIAVALLLILNSHGDLLAALKAIRLYGELADVSAGDVFGTSGKKPPSKDVFQFPRHLLEEIDAAIAKATT